MATHGLLKNHAYAFKCQQLGGRKVLTSNVFKHPGL